MSTLVVLLGPVKHWWDDNWHTAQHRHYALWRTIVSETLVQEGFLVYRPHEAFKGTWDERGQVVNDAAISLGDVILNLTPDGIPSEGTDQEMALCADRGKIVFPAPPPRWDVDMDESEYEVRYRQQALVVAQTAAGLDTRRTT